MVRTLQSANNHRLLKYTAFVAGAKEDSTQSSCSTLHCTLEAIQPRNVEGAGEGGGGGSHRLAYVEVRGKRSAGNWPFKDVQQAGV
jgi:hypothetical protein